MKLVNNVSKMPLMASNWASALIIIVAGVQAQWDDVFSAAIPEQYQTGIYAALALMAIIGRAVDQGLEN